MQSLRDIRRRIKSIDSTRQIARAMEMVSAARLKRAQERLFAARPYAESLEGIVKRICSSNDGPAHPFLFQREKKTVGICVISSDRGLCGAFNVNVIHEAERIERKIAEAGDVSKTATPGRNIAEVHFIPVGRKALRHFRRKETAPLFSIPELGAFADRRAAGRLAGQLSGAYIEGKLDEIWIVFTQFVSSGTRHVLVSRLLPLEFETDESVNKRQEYIYEPYAQELLGVLLPKHVATKVFRAFAESCASEHSARMVAMSFATRNADEMVDEFTLLANRARQSSITREIADIVGTAEVLR